MTREKVAFAQGVEEGLGSFVTWNGSEAPLPVLKFGKRWLFDKADLDSYVDRGPLDRQAKNPNYPLSLREYFRSSPRLRRARPNLPARFGFTKRTRNSPAFATFPMPDCR